MFSGKKNECHFKAKETQATSLRPHFKFSIPLSAFLISWFLLILIIFWFPPRSETDSSPQTKFNQPEEFKVQSISTATGPACNESFSIYVYDLPSKFNVKMLKHCRHLNIYTDMCPHVANRGLGQPFLFGLASSNSNSTNDGGRGSWFATNQFVAEMIFHARVENHPCRTRDPDSASLFYVPFYGGLDVSSKFREPNHAARDALAVELAEYIRRQRWWQNHHGKDHFLALGRTAWDFMRTNHGGADFGANCLLNLSPVRNMSVLIVERHPWQGSNQHGIPYPSYFHPSSTDEILAWQDKMAKIERPHLFSFVGAPRTDVQKAAVRNEIIKQCADSTRCNLLKCGGGGGGTSNCHDPKSVLKVMTTSHFCLQAPGDSFTRRSTFDAVVAGCIPVFFSPHTAYSQYAWYFPADPGEYSVFVDGERNGSWRMEAELMKIPAERVERMRRTIIGLIATVTYAHPNSSGYGFRDAVDVALAALSKHVDAIKSPT